MILFQVAVALFLLSLLGIFLVNARRGKEFWDTWLGPFFVVVLLVSFIVGLVAIPLLRTYKVEYREITNYQILKSSDAIIIDLTNSNAKISDFNNLIRYNSYRAVTDFSDSTKVFERMRKGFYGDVIIRSYVWSNPPYKFYNQE